MPKSDWSKLSQPHNLISYFEALSLFPYTLYHCQSTRDNYLSVVFFSRCTREIIPMSKTVDRIPVTAIEQTKPA